MSGTGAGPLEVTWATAGIKTVTLQIDLGACSTAPNSLNVEVLPNPIIDITPASSAICSGQAVTLNASGGVSYQWEPAPGLVTPNTSPTVSVSPPSETTYTVYGTAPNGCVAFDTAHVDVDIFQLLFRESMGTVPTTTAVAAHEAANGFDNDNLTMSAVAADVRSSLPSSGYAEASGGANVLINFNNVINPSYVFQIDGINTYGMSNLELSFGIRKNTAASDGSELAIETSTDGGTTWSAAIPFTPLPPGSASAAIWHYVNTAPGAIPAAQNLSIRFRQTAQNVQFRLDDILLRNPWAAPEITASGPTTICGGGSVTLTASGANNFSWSTGATTQTITVTQSGSYTVTVSDANNCVKTSLPIVVSTTGTPPPVASNNGPVCAGQALQLSATGDPLLAYAWTGPNGFTSTDQHPSIGSVTAANAGIYTVTVTVPGCGSASDTTLVVLNTGNASFTYPSSTYCVTAPGTAVPTLAVPGSAGTFTALPAGLVITDSTGVVDIAASAVGTYTVTFTTSGACSATHQVQLTIANAPSAEFAFADSAYCQSAADPAPVFGAGASAGTFTSSPSGLEISASTGVVDLSLSQPGTYQVINTITPQGGCAAAADTTTITVLLSPAAPAASNNGPICVGEVLQLSASGDTTFTYSWSGPAGFTSAVQNPAVPGLAAGSYTYSVTVTSGAGCASLPGATTAQVEALPATPVLSSNPICAGSTLLVSVSNPLTGGTYLWTGPAGDTLAATGPAVSIPAATTAQGGSYTAVVTSAGGCVSAAGSINAVVTDAPLAPVASSNTPVCAGQTLTLFASAVPGATYSWTGPGFASTQQNPTRGNAQPSMAGSYTVYALLNGCVSPAAVTQVVISPNPAPPVLTSNSPICQGATLELSAQGVPGAAYNWTSPGGATYTGQLVVVPAVPASANGVWSATQTVNGCTSAAGALQVTINPAPSAPVVFSNSPVCEGQTLTLSTILVPGASYTWTAANGATHLGQILTITNTLPTDSGQYTLISSLNGCTSPATIVNAIVAPEPAVPTIFTNSPVCAGQTLTLSTSPVAGASYFWTGPQGTYNTQVVTIPGATPVTSAYAGGYSLFVESNYGCVSDTSVAQVVVNPTPAAPFLSSNSPVCQGDSLFLSASGSWSSGATFAWTGPNGYGTTLQNPVRANAQPAYSGNYTFVVTENGCTSLPAVVSVVVHAAPVLNAVSNNGPLCTGATLQLSANSFANGTYTWSGPNGFVSSVQNPSIANVGLAHAGNYTVSVTDANGCHELNPGVTTVVINPTPVVVATANDPLCEGDNLLLTATGTPGGSYSWSGPNGFTSTVSNPTVFNAQLAAGGTYHVWVSANGCTGEDTVHVTVHPEPTAPVPTSNSPICAEQTLQLFAAGPPQGASVVYSWTGPNGYASSQQNPVIANATVAMQGLYEVVVYVNGCPSPVGIVQVTIYPVPAMSLSQTNPLICEGQSTTLSATGTGAISFSWTPAAGLSATTTQVTTATPAVTTTYTLHSANSQGCVAQDTITVTVLPAVIADAGADQTGLCPGTSTTLAAVQPATGTGLWTIFSGTGGTLQNPAQANSLFTGQLNESYTLVWTVTNLPCDPSSDTVEVNFYSSEPAPVITLNNSPICAGQELQLATSLVPGASYSWTGPLGGYTGQVLTITNATAAHSGPYTLVYTTSVGCESAPVIVDFVVTPLPAAPVFSSNAPLCAGNTLTLSAATVADAGYTWTGPNGFTSTVQHPTIANVTAAHAGSTP